MKMFYFLILIVSSCNPDIDQSNVITTGIDRHSPRNSPCVEVNSTDLPKLLWKKDFSDNALVGSINPLLTEKHIIISRSADFRPPDEVLCFSKENGEMIWQWDNFFNPYDLLSNVETYYILNDVLYLGTCGSMYEINTQNGSTLSRQNYGRISKIGSYGDEEWVSISYKTEYAVHAAVINIDSKKLIVCATVQESPEYKGSISVPYVVGVSCYFSFNSWNFVSHSNSSILHRVDIIDNTPVIVWRREFEGKGTIGNWGYQVLGNRLYVIDRALYCININDGAILWEQPDIYGGPAGLIIADNKLIVGSNHLNPSLYAFDLFTGEILWMERTSGTSSPLQFHNCVIYTVGGGDGLLHAVDVKSGKHLYKMTSPDYANDSNLFFGNCKVDPETNSIYLTNYKYLLKYQLPEY